MGCWRCRDPSIGVAALVWSNEEQVAILISGIQTWVSDYLGQCHGSPCSFVQLTVPSLFVTRWTVWQSSDLTCYQQVRSQWRPTCAEYVSVCTGVLHSNIVKQTSKGQSFHLPQAYYVYFPL